jgi:hypothetical protein
MVFYVFLGLVFLGIVFWATRSPVVRQLLRGRGTDPGQWGSRLDHLADQGTGGSGINDDGSGGRRASRIQSKHTRRR